MRGMILLIVNCSVLFIIPIVALLQKLEVIRNIFDVASFWRIWLFFVLGWVADFLTSTDVSVRTFGKLSGVYNLTLFDMVYGFQVQAICSFICHIGTVIFFSVRYNITRTYSDYLLIGIMTAVSVVGTAILTLIVSRFVFGMILYKKQ